MASSLMRATNRLSTMLYSELTSMEMTIGSAILVSSGKIDADKMEKDFTEIIEFWKSIFLKKGQAPEGDAKGE